MVKSTAEKPSKKRKVDDVKSVAINTATAPAPAQGFKVDPKFKRVHPDALADFGGVENGTSELWLIQMPRSVQLDSITDTDIYLSEEGGKQIVNGSITCSLGAVDATLLAEHMLVEEGASLGREHYCLAPMSSRVTLSSLPISKRITLLSKRVLEQANEAHAAAAADQPQQQQEQQAPPSSSKKDKKRRSKQQQEQQEQQLPTDKKAKQQAAQQQPGSSGHQEQVTAAATAGKDKDKEGRKGKEKTKDKSKDKEGGGSEKKKRKHKDREEK